MAAMAEAKLDMYDDATYTVDPQHIEGDMTIDGKQKSTQGNLEFNTLDEPIKDTILRDIRVIGKKFFHVLYPKEKKSLLKEWDLWGPLIICIFVAITEDSYYKAPYNTVGGPYFANLFFIIWIGALCNTLNSKLLGANISIFQSFCVFGYCLLPITIALIVSRFIMMAEQTTLLHIVRFVIATIGISWSTYASMTFLGDSHPEGRKALAVYPMFLFYFIFSWKTEKN